MYYTKQQIRTGGNRVNSAEIVMKRESLNLNCENVSMLSIYGARQHYKTMMRFGVILPTTKAQAKFFITEKCKLDVLAHKDVEIIEGILNEAGLEGDYTLTKSKRWARLSNINDFYSALKVKYQL